MVRFTVSVSLLECLLLSVVLNGSTRTTTATLATAITQGATISPDGPLGSHLAVPGFTAITMATFAIATTPTLGSILASDATKVVTTNLPLLLAPAPTSHDKREIVVDEGGHTRTASQYPAVTTQWWETALPNGVHTWIPITFTQTFATSIQDPWPSPKHGVIGLADATTADGHRAKATDMKMSAARGCCAWSELIKTAVCVWVFMGILARLVGTM